MGIDMVENAHLKGSRRRGPHAAELDLLERAGFRTNVRIADMAAFDRRQAAKTRAYGASVAPRRCPPGAPVPPPRDYNADLKELAKDYRRSSAR